MADQNNSSNWLWWIGGLVAIYFLFIAPAMKRKKIEAIERVLQADSVSTLSTKSVAVIVQRMQEINLSDCPDDFRTAYIAHIQAWEQMELVEHQAKAFDEEFNSVGTMVESFIRGFFLDPLGKANEAKDAQGKLQAEYARAAQAIRSTFYQVKRIAVEHGATLPKKRSPSHSSSRSAIPVVPLRVSSFALTESTNSPQET